MRVLLVSTNRADLMVRPFPLGAAYIVASLQAQGHEVDVWDAMFEGDWAASLRQRLRDFRPAVIGLSVRNVDDQEIRGARFLLGEAREMAAACRQESEAVLVAGGAAFSMFPAEALSYLGVDYGIVGEGERAFPQLLAALEAGEDPAGIPGLVWRSDDGVHEAPQEFVQDLDELPVPDRRLLEPARYYESRGTAPIPNVATVQAKRGCPRSCIYCVTRVIEGPTHRLRSPERVVDEVEALAAMGERRIQFVDSLFTNPPEHAEAICKELIRRRVEVGWSCTINPAFAPPDLLRLMKQAGCQLAMVGNEAGCDRQLDALRKGFSKAETARCFSLLESEGIRYNAFLLLGGPGEDRASVDESVEFMQQWSPSLVSVTIGIRIYPRCELAQIAAAEGVLEPGADLLPPRFYLAEPVREWIFGRVDPVVAANDSWMY